MQMIEFMLFLITVQLALIALALNKISDKMK
jgi:hypothetical protein